MPKGSQRSALEPGGIWGSAAQHHLPIYRSLPDADFGLLWQGGCCMHLARDLPSVVTRGFPCLRRWHRGGSRCLIARRLQHLADTSAGARPASAPGRRERGHSPPPALAPPRTLSLVWKRNGPGLKS
jgi:hypothetical protein